MEEQMEIDQHKEGWEGSEDQDEEKKAESPISPKTNSPPATPSSFHSRKTCEETALWSQRKEQLDLALQHVLQASNHLSWLHSQSIRMLSEELTSLSAFYQFLLETKAGISFPEWGYFSVLPTELTLLIFSHLDFVSLCRVSQVCKEFNAIANEERLWKRIAERINLPFEDKPESRTFKWLCQSRLHKFREGEERNNAGTYYFNVGTKKGIHCYSGDWACGKRHGFGSFYWEKDAGKHTGEWRDDKREGWGIRIWPNGNKYVGEYKNHKRHGRGTFTFSNGSKFSGTFEENKFLFGTYTWPNGRVYTGEWNNTNRHGTGTYWWPDGRVYEGEWKNDKRHGHAIYRWPDGDYFEGEFVDGARWGRGILICKDGDVYDQEWRELKFDEHNKGLLPADPSNAWNVFTSVKRKKAHEDDYTNYRRKSPKIE